MSKRYLETKNYIHNELGINKEYVEKLAESYIEKCLDQAIKDKIESKWMENKIISKIGEVLSGKPSYGRYGTNNSGEDYFKMIIKNTIKDEVIARINFDKIDLK